jgi:hypothetical protein
MWHSRTASSLANASVVFFFSTYHTGVVLEVEEDTVESLPGLGLADDNGGVDLLSELGLSLLDCGHNHVADTASRQSVEASTNTLNGDDVEVSCTRVVGAVHDGTPVPNLVSLSVLIRARYASQWSMGRVVRGRRRGSTYTGRARVILSLPPGAPRLLRNLC